MSIQTRTTAAETKPSLKDFSLLQPVLLSMKQCVVLDIETTGLSPDKHAEIIEIGAVRLDLERRKILKKMKCYIRPSDAFTIPAHITELTGIAWQNVEDAPYIEEVLPVLAGFIGDLPVVAHNAAFDWIRFLVPAFQMVGLHMTNECICTMRLSKELYPGRGKNGYNLESLCEVFGHQITGHHDALSDSVTTASLFVKLLEEYKRQYKDDPNEAVWENAPALNPLSSRIPQACFEDLKVYRVSPNKGISKRHGPRIYVTTNIGRLVYSVRRRMWTCLELWTPQNAPVALWSRWVLHKMGLDMDAFVKKYSECEKTENPQNFSCTV